MVIELVYNRMTPKYFVFVADGGPNLPFGQLYIPKIEMPSHGFAPEKIEAEIHGLEPPDNIKCKLCLQANPVDRVTCWFCSRQLEKEMPKVYTIRIQSEFVLTPSEVKRKLGIGYKVLDTSVEKVDSVPDIKDNVSAMEAIIKTGYRTLARANHPDLGGDAEVMTILNKTRKELDDLIEELSK